MKQYIIKYILRFLHWYTKASIDDTNVFDETNSFHPGSRVRITEWGKFSSCNYNSNIARAKIGNFCTISHHVTIGPRDHIFTNFSTNDIIYKNTKEHLFDSGFCWDDKYFCKIGHDVWIGCHSIILKGVEIGNGAIVAAGSVVTKSVAPYAIVAGNPARFIRSRFTKEQINLLEKLHWYEWSLDEILSKKGFLEEQVNFDLKNFIEIQGRIKPYLKN